MRNEASDLGETLAYTAVVIAKADEAERAKICEGYEAARLLSASMSRPGVSLRSRVKACLAEFNKRKAEGDLAAAGWMLVAMQTRLEASNLDRWAELKALADLIEQQLVSRTKPTQH